MDKVNVLVNAYACNPDWGSEQGIGWHWAVELAKYCKVIVITEGEFRENIERALSDLPQKENLTFVYNNVSDKVRQMCWNQGDWRFYYYYRQWQKRTLEIARRICIVAQRTVPYSSTTTHAVWPCSSLTSEAAVPYGHTGSV